MKNIVAVMILVIITIGCEPIPKESAETTSYEVERGVLTNYMFSSDPLVEKTYADCINNLSEDCKPVRGMTVEQFKELRTLEFGSCHAKMDWRDSQGNEQWSERYMDRNFTRFYTFKNGRLADWMDIRD